MSRLHRGRAQLRAELVAADAALARRRPNGEEVGLFARESRGVMNCRDVREVADSFLCEELLTETNHEILRHLDTCPSCRTELHAASPFARRSTDRLQSRPRTAARWGIRGPLTRSAPPGGRAQTSVVGVIQSTARARRRSRPGGRCSRRRVSQQIVGAGRAAGAGCDRRSSQLRAEVSAGQEPGAARRGGAALRQCLSLAARRSSGCHLNSRWTGSAWLNGTPASMAHIGSGTSSCSTGSRRVAARDRNEQSGGRR